MLNFMSGEFLKLRKSISYRVMIIIFIVFASLDLLIIYYSHSALSKGLDIFDFSALSTLPSCMGDNNFLLLIGIFTCIFVIQDFSSGTIRQTISKGISRPAIFFGKIFLTYLSTIVFNVIMLLIYFLGTGLIAGFGTVEGSIGIFVLKVIITLLLSNAVYTSIAVLFSILSKNLGLSITFICLLSFIAPVIIAIFSYIWDEKLLNLLLSTTTSLMLSQTTSTSDFTLYSLYLLAFTTVCTVISFFVFRKNEF